MTDDLRKARESLLLDLKNYNFAHREESEAFVAAYDAEIKRLTNKVDEVVAHAVRVIGEACEVHQGLAKRQGFAEFYSKYPKGCAWCSADRVLFLESQNLDAAKSREVLVGQLAEAQRENARMREAIARLAESVTLMANAEHGGRWAENQRAEDAYRWCAKHIAALTPKGDAK